MPIPDEVRNYRSMLDHTQRLKNAVFHERWLEVEALWFDHFALHKKLGPPSTEERPHAEAILQCMSEISKLLIARKQDIALLLRITP